MEHPNILMVQDESKAAGLRVKLEAIGFVVSTFVTFSEAVLDTIAAHRPDIVLMDITSAGHFTGIEIAEQISKTYDIPVICLIAQNQERIMQQVKSTSSVDYLLQPFRDQDLQAAIEMGLYENNQVGSRRETRKTLRELKEANELLRAEIIGLRRTEEQLRHYADEQAALVAVTSAASAFLEPDVLLSKILEVVMTIPGIQADAGWVFTLEEYRKELIHLGPVQGISEELLNIDHTMPLNSCPVCATWLEGTGLTEVATA